MIFIIDINDPSNPTLVGSYDPPGVGHVLDVFVSNGDAFVACNYGLHIIDITDPTSPIFKAGYQTPGISFGVFADNNNHIFMADRYSLQILRFIPPTDVEEVNSLPHEFTLSQNYPNPFNASTQITFSLPEPQEVALTVYNLLGRKVETLLDDYQPAGVHHITFDASDLASGIYFYRIQAGETVESKRMVLLK